MILEARRYTSQQAFEAKIIDGLGGLDETLEFVKSRNLTQKGVSKAYGGIKEDMYRQTISFTDSHRANKRWRYVVETEKETNRNDALEKIEAWEKTNGKAKL